MDGAVRFFGLRFVILSAAKDLYYSINLEVRI